MSALTQFVLRHRRLVGLIWLLALIVGGYASSVLSGHLSTSFEIPGTPSDIADSAIVAHYRTGGTDNPLVPVIRLPPGTTAAQSTTRADLGAAFAAASRLSMAAHAGPSRFASYASTGNPGFVSADGRTTFGLVFTPTRKGQFPTSAVQPAAMQAAMQHYLPPGSQVRVTGLDPLTNAGGSGSGPGVGEEILIGAIGAFAVLAFVFASLLAVIPLLIAAVSTTTAFLAILGLTTFMTVNFVVQFIVGLIGLGVAIDYSLLLITRWREELAKGGENEDAIRAAMHTAGRAIVFSGVTVALGLLALIALPIPFIRSIGIGGMLIPLISVLVTLTLVPAVLAGAGPRLEWPRLRHEGTASRGWTAWAKFVVRRRWLAAAAGMAILLALGITALGMNVGDASVNSLSQKGDARTGVVMLEHAGIPIGVLAPIEVVVPARSSAQSVAAIRRVSGLHAVVAPTGPAWNRAGTSLIEALPTADPSGPEAQATVSRVRDELASTTPPALVGGYSAGLVDQVHSLYGDFPYVLIGLAVITFILLARAFRSLLLPIKAVLANLLSVAAVYGVLVLVWQDGYGSRPIWGLPATGAITGWIPLFVFAFVYGLSMDYEVFILSRMREEYDATGSTSRAVTVGIGRTGRLVTSAALILFLAMAALASAPYTFLKIFATGVGAGILLDATVVRSLLVPAIVSLLGRWNWWLPDWAARLLRVAPSPLPATDPIPDRNVVSQPSR
ncbi:MAG TPA: MMPL family transporter [Streptosporangiaceae bacterium]|nr:MMPL family transporter [Streptosporangiaceae bacterium]